MGYNIFPITRLNQRSRQFNPLLRLPFDGPARKAGPVGA
jgi:hypothetical protein